MSNFKVHFTNPWLMLLLIPAALLTLILYLRLNKKYRRTRNRITSIVLHCIVMFLCISVLSGTTFSYEKPNTENEVILLVDMSDSGSTSVGDKNEFVKSVIDEADSTLQIGVMTFGFGETVYAAEKTLDTDGLYNQYLRARKPSGIGTDVASALKFAREAIDNPESAKIVILSDGFETDGYAMSVIKELASEGIRVDTVYFPSDSYEKEVQLLGATLPDYSVKIGDPFPISLTLDSTFEGKAEITLYDTDLFGQVTQGETQEVTLTGNVQTLNFTHSFELPELHKLSFVLECDEDETKENNQYCTYMYLETFENILVVEGASDEGKLIEDILAPEYKGLEFCAVDDAVRLPSTIEALSKFDQVILMNVRNEDLVTSGFDKLLYRYVHELGGGLLTVGGDQAYTFSDMNNSIYQNMLPVRTVEKYTPPLALVIIIDRSGSMDSDSTIDEQSFFDLAKAGAKSLVNYMEAWDWCGVITLEDDSAEHGGLLPLTRKKELLNNIEKIESGGGGTVFTSSIKSANTVLSACTQVEKKHIIILSDGQPGDSAEDYTNAIAECYAKGITTSIAVIGGNTNAYNVMKDAAENYGGGKAYDVSADGFEKISQMMRADLDLSIITDTMEEEFTPNLNTAGLTYSASVLNGLVQEEMFTLGGIHGTKLKDGAEAPLLRGTYVPIYAQWKFGAGMVGSLMCDLIGTWSSDIFNTASGQTFLSNVINCLFPKERIEEQKINVKVTEDNFSTRVNVFTQMDIDDKIEVWVTSPEDEHGSVDPAVCYIPDTDTGYGSITFVGTRSGVYTIRVVQKNAADQEIASFTTYRTFSYSEEYDAFRVEEDGEEALAAWATAGKGKGLSKPEEALDGFARTLKKSYDPRFVFIIVALALFLLDIAVRKFKFKWPHEIIRDRKAKKLLKQGGRV